MNRDIFARSIGLLGEDNFNKLQDKVIAVFGLGGVGGTALEALARTGFQHFVIIDFDKVDASNLNRQILYTSKDIGRDKVEAAKERLLAINPEVDVKIFKGKAQEFDFNQKLDFVVDAIDDVEGKLYILQKCKENNIQTIMSLGMANRFNPEQVRVMKLNQTSNDPLAKKIRYLVKHNNIDIKDVMVVISEELPQKNQEKLYSTMMVPSSAGLTIAKYILNRIIISNE
ncbi:MAG: ThiF family adenylyltransferase [Bacilli bacterium]|nr:ThiF family adenylyltransferase [Bacilli bacterium]